MTATWWLVDLIRKFSSSSFSPVVGDILLEIKLEVIKTKILFSIHSEDLYSAMKIQNIVALVMIHILSFLGVSRKMEIVRMEMFILSKKMKLQSGSIVIKNNKCSGNMNSSGNRIINLLFCLKYDFSIFLKDDYTDTETEIIDHRTRLSDLF